MKNLTEEQKKKINELIDEFPNDGTDWDGIHDDVILKILKNHEDAEKYRRQNKEAIDAIIEQNLKLGKIVERVKQTKADTQAMISKDNPNNKELQQIFNLLNYILDEKK